MSNDKVDEWYKEFYEETKNAPSVLENEIMEVGTLAFIGLVFITILGIFLLIFDR